MAVGNILKRIGGILLGTPTPKTENLTIDLGGGVTMEFIKCPPGTFMMGSPETGSEIDSIETQHEVTLTRGFWLGKYPVTQAQWKAVMNNNPSEFQGDDQRPVEQVSWNDGQEFLNKLNSRCDGVYRLPTEAEWEYACRAGTTTAYYFGDDTDLLCDYAWYKNNSGGQTHPVGQKRPNAWELHDMHGNVLEWCQDRGDSYPSGVATDPTGPPSGNYRVLRGGSWCGLDFSCRCATRDRNAPGYQRPFIGFRVVRTI